MENPSKHDYTSFPTDIPTAPLLTISFKKLLSNDAAEQGRLFHASKTLGFFYLDLTGCEPGEALLASSSTMFDLMHELYQLPLEEKQKYDFAAQGSYFGYKGVGAEVVDGKGTKDKNEIYNISKDDILSLSPSPLPSPPLLQSARPHLTSYIQHNTALLTTLFTSLATSLSLPASTFTSLHRLTSPSGCHARFIRASPQPIDQRSLALGEHTDFGSLTVLFNRVGGLQVLLPGAISGTSDPQWVYVRPLPNCAIINLGDAMVKFSAGILRSNMHRVVNPPGAQADMVRYSLVYFSRPEHTVRMQRVRGGLVDEHVKRQGQGKEESKEVKEGKGEKEKEEDGEEDVDVETTEQWLKRRHQGRKIQFFKGNESWQKAIGTETVV